MNRENVTTTFARLNPPQVLAFGFLVLIVVGALALRLPLATVSGYISPVDALFTATSAVAVTGLVVVDTGTYFTTFGQVVIITLIQIGGLGIMTAATAVALILGKKITLRERLVIQEQFNELTLQGLVRLIRLVLAFTFTMEFTAALIFMTRFIPRYGISRGIFISIFHAISAFCNAGFDLFGGYRSLTIFQDDPVVNFVTIILIITGGIGFSVVADLYSKRSFARLSLHSKIVISVTVLLLVLGTAVILPLEWNNPDTLGPLSAPVKFMASFFTAVTPRTAGFNVVPTGGLRSATLFFIIILMFIGASPGSTGGGVKTATMTGLVLMVYSIIKGDTDVTVFNKRLSMEILLRSLAIVAISFALVVVTSMVLLVTEDFNFLKILFESTSAFGTVGLSTGITTGLSVAGRLMISFTMFTGRVGPLTLAFALAQGRHRGKIRYPEEKIIVG